MKVDPRFKDTEYCIEADDYTRHSLWQTWSTEAIFKHPHCNNINWKEDCMGTMTQVGQVNDMPVTVTFFWAKLNGHLILFYNATSQVVDHRMVESWLDKYCKTPRTNANNFHQVISYIRESVAQKLIEEA